MAMLRGKWWDVENGNFSRTHGGVEILLYRLHDTWVVACPNIRHDAFVNEGTEPDFDRALEMVRSWANELHGAIHAACDV